MIFILPVAYAVWVWIMVIEYVTNTWIHVVCLVVSSRTTLKYWHHPRNAVINFSTVTALLIDVIFLLRKILQIYSWRGLFRLFISHWQYHLRHAYPTKNDPHLRHRIALLIFQHYVIRHDSWVCFLCYSKQYCSYHMFFLCVKGHRVPKNITHLGMPRSTMVDDIVNFTSMMFVTIDRLNYHYEWYMTIQFYISPKCFDSQLRYP